MDRRVEGDPPRFCHGDRRLRRARTEIIYTANILPIERCAGDCCNAKWASGGNLGTSLDFDIELKYGAGACLRDRADPLDRASAATDVRCRSRNSSLWKKPTVVNNVETRERRRDHPQGRRLVQVGRHIRHLARRCLYWLARSTALARSKSRWHDVARHHLRSWRRILNNRGFKAVQTGISVDASPPRTWILRLITRR